MSKFTPIETVLNIFDPNILWLEIEGFNGYEISTTGHIRSMKHYKKYPYGLLVKPVSSADPSNPIYELSDDNNNRKRLHYSEIANLANNNSNPTKAKTTMNTDNMSRNKFVKNDSGAYVKVYNGRKRTVGKLSTLDDTNTNYAKFTIIKEGENM